jgi:hypothetical protein
VVTIYTGKVPGYIGVGDCISLSTVEGQAAGGDSPIRPLNSPMIVWGVGV